MLYVCATPIGNLDDVTLRVLATLRKVDVVLCEDTRHSRGFFRRHELSPRTLLSFHEHNEEARLRHVLGLLEEGADVALITDAGMPGLADPGFTLVRACVEAGIEVTVLPGASAPSTALVASGLPTDRFVFVGFLPRGAAKVRAALEDTGSCGATVVAFESPHRLRSTLRVIAERWPRRNIVVCRELTKLHEQVLRGTADEVLDSLAERVRGEIVLVIGPADVSRSPRTPAGTAVAGDEEDGREDFGTVGPYDAPGRDAMLVLDALLAGGLRTKEASAVVSRLSGIDARTAYALAQEAKARREAATEGERRPGRAEPDAGGGTG
jgi:16S rRNA (cytidine1402-2'-O)-methyltransferase